MYLFFDFMVFKIKSISLIPKKTWMLDFWTVVLES